MLSNWPVPIVFPEVKKLIRYGSLSFPCPSHESLRRYILSHVVGQTSLHTPPAWRHCLSSPSLRRSLISPPTFPPPQTHSFPPPHPLPPPPSPHPPHNTPSTPLTRLHSFVLFPTLFLTFHISTTSSTLLSPPPPIDGSHPPGF